MERVAYLRVAVHNPRTTPLVQAMFPPGWGAWSFAGNICILPERGRQKSKPAACWSPDVYKFFDFSWDGPHFYWVRSQRYANSLILAETVLTYAMQCLDTQLFLHIMAYPVYTHRGRALGIHYFTHRCAQCKIQAKTQSLAVLCLLWNQWNQWPTNANRNISNSS